MRLLYDIAAHALIFPDGRIAGSLTSEVSTSEAEELLRAFDSDLEDELEYAQEKWREFENSYDAAEGRNSLLEEEISTLKKELAELKEKEGE